MYNMSKHCHLTLLAVKRLINCELAAKFLFTLLYHKRHKTERCKTDLKNVRNLIILTTDISLLEEKQTKVGYCSMGDFNKIAVQLSHTR